MRGLSRGVPVLALAPQIERAVKTVRLRAGCVECNHDQITSLCAELSSDYGFEVEGLDLDSLLADGDACRALGRFDLLVTTTFHGGEVQELATRCNRPWIAVSPRADVFAEIAHDLTAGPVYFVLTDPRFAKKLQKIYASRAGASNLRALIHGTDDLSAIPDSAPTYLTRSVRDQLRDHPLVARARPDARIFSSVSAREILTFIATSNIAAAERR